MYEKVSRQRQLLLCNVVEGHHGWLLFDVYSSSSHSNCGPIAIALLQSPYFAERIKLQQTAVQLAFAQLKRRSGVSSQLLARAAYVCNLS